MTVIAKKDAQKLNYGAWQTRAPQNNEPETTGFSADRDYGLPRSRQPKSPLASISAWRSIHFATSGSVRRIQVWLETHCEGRWHIDVTGVDKHLATKFGKVHFENGFDKQHFKAVFSPKAKTRQAAFNTPSFASARMAA